MFLWLAKSTLLGLGKDLLRLAIWLVRVRSASQSQREILGFQTTNHPVIIGCWGREEIESNMSLPGCETAGAAL